MTKIHKRKHLFRSAEEDRRNAAHLGEVEYAREQVNSPAYRLAFDDIDFLTREEMRAVRLQLELVKPELLLQEAGIERTVVIFGSARISSESEAVVQLDITRAGGDEVDIQEAQRRLEQSRFYEEARKLSALVSTHSGKKNCPQLHVVTGGGPGIMEAANRGAAEVGAKSVGLNIVLPHEQYPNPYTTPELCFQFHYFAIRKMHFLLRARALVAFPGGFGTMDELFEALTLIQTGKIEPMPLLLFGKDYWQQLVNFDFLVKEAVISAEDLALFRFVDTAEEAWDIIQAEVRE
jgi:uncharacterized protein (TIGR00730 family)